MIETISTFYGSGVAAAFFVLLLVEVALGDDTDVEAVVVMFATALAWPFIGLLLLYMGACQIRDAIGGR